MSQLSRTLASVAKGNFDGQPPTSSVVKTLTAAFTVVGQIKGRFPNQSIDQLWAIATHGVATTHFGTYLPGPHIADPSVDGLTFDRRLSKKSSKASFTFIDLFAGIGGFHLALSGVGGQCVFASEWDNSARLTYAMNHGIVPFGDIRDYTRSGTEPKSSEEVRNLVPYADVIAAGFPCQPFSQAGVSSRNFHGKEHGLLCEAQGTLFEDILIIARAIRPKVLLLENVSNLARHDGGNTIRVISSEIEKAGYTIFPKRDDLAGSKWATIDSQSVVAQRRKRIYFVCVRNDLVVDLGDFDFPAFPLPKEPFPLEQILNLDDEMTEEEKLRRYSITPRLWASHQERELRHIAAKNGFRIGIANDLSVPAPTLVARYYKDGKDCLIPNRLDPTQPPRMLTPRECALLQTFPKTFWIPASKTPAYKQFGNSITVEIARRIAKTIQKQYL